MKFLWCIVVDEDCEVDNWTDVMWRVVVAVDADKDVHQGPVIYTPDPLEEEAGNFMPPVRGLGLDATMAHKGRHYPARNSVSKELKAKVAARWQELGLPW